MRTLALALLLFVSACTTTPRDDAPLSWSDPSDVGFSSEKLAAIGSAMEAFQQAHGGVEPGSIDPEQAEQLRELGYIE